jgi:hypothetical protein
MGDLDERDVNRLETEYRRILDALVFSQGSKAEVHRAVRKRGLEKAWQAGSPTLESQARDLTAAAVRGWFGKDAKVPTLSSHLDALKDVVSEALPEAAEEFASVADALRRVREGNQRNTKGPIERRTSLYKLGYISTPVASAGELDWDRLLLGSWVFDGDLPPYVHRQSDSLTIEALANPERKVVTITGSPKSGKTRSLIECLSRSPLKANDVYWLSPQPGAIELFLKNVPEGTLASAVVVLDDLQKFSFDPTNGLTLDRLERLSKAAKVLITLHESSLASWKHDQTDHTSGSKLAPPRELVKELEASRIRYSTTLLEDEKALANALLGEKASHPHELGEMASWLASVDYLHTVLEVLRNGNRMEVCLVGAIVDIRILRPRGSSINIFREYTVARLNKLSPSAQWSEAQWESAWEKLTTGVNPTSPHAILVQTSDDQVAYQILDALWPSLIPDAWDPWHLDEPTLPAWGAASAAFYAGLPETIVQNLLDEGISRGESASAAILGWRLDELGDPDRGLELITQALNDFNPEKDDTFPGVIEHFLLQHAALGNGNKIRFFAEHAIRQGVKDGWPEALLGWEAWGEFRIVEAKKLFLASLALIRKQGDKGQTIKAQEAVRGPYPISLEHIAEIGLAACQLTLDNEADTAPLEALIHAENSPVSGIEVVGLSILAVHLIRRREFKRAREALEFALSSTYFPRSVEAILYINLGFISEAEGRMSEAESHLRTAVDVLLRNGYRAGLILFPIASFLRRKTESRDESERLYEQAEDELRSLLAKFDPSAILLFHQSSHESIPYDSFDVDWIRRVTGHDLTRSTTRELMNGTARPA